MRFATLLLLLPALAQEPTGDGLPKPPPRMPVDASPSAFACTLARLLRDERCTFEFEPAAQPASEAQAVKNQRRALEAGRACAGAATPNGELQPDAALLRQCETDLAGAVSARCGLEGRVPLEDDSGHWAAAAAGCASELQAVLARTRTRAAVSLGCCRCLASARCRVPMAQCLREVHEDRPSDELRACGVPACAEACSQVRDQLPPEPPMPAEPPPARKSNLRSEPKIQKT